MKEAAMHMARRTTIELLAALAVALGACGDDNNGKLSTGVDKNKPLGGVSPAEAEQICRSTENWARRTFAEAKQRELGCRITALAAASVMGFGSDGTGSNVSDAQLQMSCASTEAQCLAAAGAGSGTTPSPTMCQSFPASCMATVAEYEACLNDVPPFVDQTASTLPRCETLNRFALLSLLGLVNSLPASCRTFQMKCGGAGIPGVPTPPGLTPPGS
jgi:hypothetical protein